MNGHSRSSFRLKVNIFSNIRTRCSSSKGGELMHD